MEKSIKFLKNAGIYFFGNVLTKILAFLLIPLYTNLIDSSNYGYYDLVVSILTLIIPIVFFQIWDGMFRFIYDYKDVKKKYSIITNGLIVSFVSIFIYLFGILIVYQFVEIRNPILVFLYGITLAFQYIYGTVSRTFEKNKLYAMSGILNTFVNLILNVILILIFKLDIEALYISVIAGNFVQIFLIERNIKPLKNFKVKDISKTLINKMVKFSMPIAITTISFWLLTGYSKVLISHKLGMSENGIFAIGMRFASALTMIVSVLQMSWHEFSFSIIEDENKKKYYSKGIELFFKSILAGIILVIPATKIVFPYFVANEYYNAIYIMPIIYLYTAMNAFSGFVSTQFLAEKDSKTTLYSTIVAALLNVILSNMLIEKYELLGITLALLISFSVNMLIRMFLLNRKFNIKLLKKDIFYALILIIICTIIYYTSNIIGNILMLIVSIIISFIILQDEIIFLINKLKVMLKGKLQR